MKERLISVPPIEVQLEIVSMLDELDMYESSLMDKLEEEKCLRKEQFDAYAIRLLTGENEGKEYENVELKQIAKFSYGYTDKATLSGKLLQMANGAVYSDEGDEIVIHDQKLDALEDMIEAANGRPVMVAYVQKSMRRLKVWRTQRKDFF